MTPVLLISDIKWYEIFRIIQYTFLVIIILRNEDAVCEATRAL
jgi:hypothetical protein